MLWLVQEFGFEKLDAYQLVTQISETPLANVCDPNYTVTAKAPKRFLPTADVYGDVRTRLTEMAAAYRSERGGLT